MTVLLLLAMLYTLIGLALSLAVHLLSFTSTQLGNDALALMWGIFPTLLLVIAIGISERRKKYPGSANEKLDDWELVLAECPTPMKRMFWACFFYAWAMGMVIAIFDSESRPSLIVRGVSALWMASYAMGLAVATAAYLRRRSASRA